MENQDERTNRKMLSAMAVAFVIVVGGFAAYYLGLIPGLGQGMKVAEELKANVESAKGSALKAKFLLYSQANPQLTPAQKTTLKALADNVDLDFQFTGIETSSSDGKGTVEINSPKLNIAIKDASQKVQSGEISAPKLFISRDVSDANHFFFHTDGNIDFSAKTDGALSKIFSISGEQPYNETKIDSAGSAGYFKSNTKNVKLIEGRGNTVLANIGESNIEGKSTHNGSNIDIYGKVSEKNIVPGDMIKIMLGNIEPISLNIDYAYKGDDYRPALQSLSDFDNKRDAEQQKVKEDPAYKPQIIIPDVKPFDGNLKLNDFSIVMGNAGFIINANLEFKKTNSTAIPFGQVNFKIAQYQKLIDYLSKFIKMPKEQMDKNVQMLSEIGKNENGDINFVISFDGTENVKVNGKTSDELKAIVTKNQPEPVAAPPAKVESKPIK